MQQRLVSPGHCPFQVRSLPTLSATQAIVQSVFACLGLVLFFVLILKLRRIQRGKHQVVFKLLIQIAAYFVIYSAHAGLSLVYYLVENPTSVLAITPCTKLIQTLRLLEIGCQSQIFLSISAFYSMKIQNQLPRYQLIRKLCIALEVASLGAMLGVLVSICLINFALVNQNERVHFLLYYIYSGANVLFSFLVMLSIGFRVLSSLDQLGRGFKKQMRERVKQTISVLLCSASARVAFKLLEVAGVVDSFRPLDSECRSINQNFAVLQFCVGVICCLVPEMVMLAIAEDCGKLSTQSDSLSRQSLNFSDLDNIS